MCLFRRCSSWGFMMIMLLLLHAEAVTQQKPTVQQQRQLHHGQRQQQQQSPQPRQQQQQPQQHQQQQQQRRRQQPKLEQHQPTQRKRQQQHHHHYHQQQQQRRQQQQQQSQRKNGQAVNEQTRMPEVSVVVTFSSMFSISYLTVAMVLSGVVGVFAVLNCLGALGFDSKDRELRRQRRAERKEERHRKKQEKHFLSTSHVASAAQRLKNGIHTAFASQVTPSPDSNRTESPSLNIESPSVSTESAFVRDTSPTPRQSKMKVTSETLTHKFQLVVFTADAPHASMVTGWRGARKVKVKLYMHDETHVDIVLGTREPKSELISLTHTHPFMRGQQDKFVVFAEPGQVIKVELCVIKPKFVTRTEWGFEKLVVMSGNGDVFEFGGDEITWFNKAPDNLSVITLDNPKTKNLQSVVLPEELHNQPAAHKLSWGLSPRDRRSRSTSILSSGGEVVAVSDSDVLTCGDDAFVCKTTQAIMTKVFDTATSTYKTITITEAD